MKLPSYHLNAVVNVCMGNKVMRTCNKDSYNTVIYENDGCQGPAMDQWNRTVSNDDNECYIMDTSYNLSWVSSSVYITDCTSSDPFIPSTTNSDATTTMNIITSIEPIESSM
eukprot:CAMPEP_0201578182 /NCGR_PEP_ID=MMETSP0190_2-20130828/24949_1 /ASSEMBLY_ACC=CAM_ASM_000263 /TAXON_ID=37353 /ORGANISM="Rosalina sp." /LENGTH=111 /DNA_ID=CAMNT_0048011087 /DNA_START=338 /DNA_END=670 /DNA_ORIENTATION=+